MSSGLRSGCVEIGEGAGGWFGGLAEFVGARAELRVYPGAGCALVAIANGQHLDLTGALDELADALVGSASRAPAPAAFETGPRPDGWFMAAGGAGVWEVRVQPDGTGGPPSALVVRPGDRW